MTPTLSTVLLPIALAAATAPSSFPTISHGVPIPHQQAPCHHHNSSRRRRHHHHHHHNPSSEMAGSAAFAAPPRHRRPARRQKQQQQPMRMIRNIDLPECVIFYGTDTVLDRTADAATTAPPVVRPGVLRFLDECTEVHTPAVLLTETYTASEVVDSICADPNLCSALGKRVEDGTLLVRSSLVGPDGGGLVLDLNSDDPSDEEDEEEETYVYGPDSTGSSPSPALLLDTINSIRIKSRGFGGSSGFGVKREGEDVRRPLPKHCVVFVGGPDGRSTDDDDYDDDDAFVTSIDGAAPVVVGEGLSESTTPTTRSRARCTAARLAGMRVVYLEFGGLGTSDADDLADATVTSLGAEDDWEVVTLDDVAMPGSYWLNPPSSRDDGGNGVDVAALCRWYSEVRLASRRRRGGDGGGGGGGGRGMGSGEEGSASSSGEGAETTGIVDTDEATLMGELGGDEDMDEDEMERILADLDSL